MTDFASLLQQGNAWVFIPSAILLGALHGLEPGHSKTMMAAFIVAIRGTVAQAALLGICATLSHTAVVWLVAMTGLYFGGKWNAEASEPYFQLASALLIIAVALWMLWRTWRQQQDGTNQDHHHGDHGHDHSHAHLYDEVKRIDTSHGAVLLDIAEDGVPPRFRLRADGSQKLAWTAPSVKAVTERPDGARQEFTFVQHVGFLESTEIIPEPHEFVVRLRLGHGDHHHDYDVEFGQVAYYTSLDGGTYQLWKYDPTSGQSTTVSLLPLSPSSIANPDITDAGLIGFKGHMGLGYGLIAAGAGSATLYAYDTNVDESSAYAYLYSPATDNGGRIASKVSTSDYSHNEIRLFNADGSSTLVVADKATDAMSPFVSFDNGLDINAADSIAVAVKLADGNARAIYRFDADGSGGFTATEIARVGNGPITDLLSFAPSINANGLIAFRAKDANGDAIYVGDGTSLKRVAGNGDVVQTDLGAAQLGQHDTSPVFSGKPAINARGDIAFVSGVYPQGDNQTEWGSGVFVAYVQGEDDTIFSDGFDVGPVEYAYDDGDGNTNQGPPSTFNPDMLWGNYFLAQPGGEVITKISVAFGPTFPSLANGPVTFWLLEDTDADGNPLNAHAIAHVQATPDVFNDNFYTVSIPPTLVHGAFFVGASAKILGGQDKPARVDTDNVGTNSWFFYAPDIAATIDDLASAPYHQTNDQTPVFPGAFMVRATGFPGP